MFAIVLLFVGGGACAYWLLLRDRPADEFAIVVFASQRGLRVISMSRSYNYFRFWLQGISVSNIARLYDVEVESRNGSKGDIQLAFDSLFGNEQPILLDQQVLVMTEADKPIHLAPDRLIDVATSWTWYERLVLFCIGAGFGGFIFCGILSANLVAPIRPTVPDAALGFTHLFKAKYGNVYGTYLESLIVTYGMWVAFGIGAVGAMFGHALGIQNKSPTYFRQIIAAAAISVVLSLAIWQLVL